MYENINSQNKKYSSSTMKNAENNTLSGSIITGSKVRNTLNSRHLENKDKFYDP